MKRVVRFLVLIFMALPVIALAQNKVDEERMERDIEVAENILSTIIKQQLGKRSFFPMEVSGEYRSGYGITFRLPNELNGPLMWSFSAPIAEDIKGHADGSGFSYSFSFDDEDIADELDEPDLAEKRAADADKRIHDMEKRAREIEERAANLSRSSRNAVVISPGRRNNSDSIRTANTTKIIEACKNFLADYGDLLSQLPSNERIVITNRGEGERIWYNAFTGANPSYISVEAMRVDISEYKQGKINRDTFNKRVKVVNSVMDDELQPDLELVSSIFNRLYRPDLSKTYFTQSEVYYERMKNYGVIYYMQVYSSNANDRFSRSEDIIYSMPTINEEGLTQNERDQKVKELYPRFEKSIKEDILEYGRTVKSLNPEESFIFNIKLTKCLECDIPESLEISIKADVLTAYSSGKITKDTALTKMTVKKGPNQ